MRKHLSLYAVASFLLIHNQFVGAADTREGKIISIDSQAGKVVIQDNESDQQRTEQIPSDVKMTRDGKTVKLNDLQNGDTVKLNVDRDGKVTEVTASEKSAKAASESDIPHFLRDLNLTQEQKDKIKGICSDCSEQRASAWKEFHERYHETVEIEASMLATIEEHLTDTQRKQIHNHRERVSHRRHHHARHNTDAAIGNRKDADRTDQNKNPVVEEVTVVGILLSPEQESVAEEVRETYFDRLHKLHGELATLHSRLIAMETERLVKIEDVLTKEQRETLRKEHQKTTHSHKSASNHAGNSR